MRAGVDHPNPDLSHQLAALEHQRGGRLGVAILHTATRRLVAHRGNERFALCSTFKLLAAALVLTRVDRREESLERRVFYKDVEVIENSPMTRLHVATGLTIGELCEAALTLSDNTAANLLLQSFGGPPALTAYLRSLGDRITRLDRREPELNIVKPGDPGDTTSPVAMLRLMQTLLVGPGLSTAARQRLDAWLVTNQTGGQRLRAGIPSGWRVGDKTGSGPSGEANDVAILWPPNRAPILVTAYYTESTGSEAERNGVLAEVGRIAATI